MTKIQFHISGSVARGRDAAYIAQRETPREALIEAVIQYVETSIEVTVGGVTMHLAGWRDPDHWSSDWEELGVEDPDELLAENEEEE